MTHSPSKGGKSGLNDFAFGVRIPPNCWLVGADMLVLSSPNVTGALHIGHALTAVIQGYILFGQATCPNMREFFDSLGVETKITDIPFAVSLYKGRSCEWGTRNGLSSLLKKNLLNPYFYQMIREILKFKDEVIKMSEVSGLDFEFYGMDSVSETVTTITATGGETT
ncbi:hypothetical protein GIB67_030391 [Kingdonia uniflora]|uniref:Uncharacterized protein n=1 Tax=Kingdonia uniflora TaxID=39325 RepID=A0A7J7NWQ2_9MAGN|nr:hypothetical protein GIB67_030391 [Kingdonia uniflora]